MPPLLSHFHYPTATVVVPLSHSYSIEYSCCKHRHSRDCWFVQPHLLAGQLQEQTRQTYFHRTDSWPTIGLCFKNNFGSKFRLTKTLLCDLRLSSNAHGGDASDFVIFVYWHLVSLRFRRSSCEAILKLADEGDFYLYEMHVRHTLTWYLYLYRSFGESPLARTIIPLASSPATMEDFAHPLR